MARLKKRLGPWPFAGTDDQEPDKVRGAKQEIEHLQQRAASVGAKVKAQINGDTQWFLQLVAGCMEEKLKESVGICLEELEETSNG